MVLDVVDAVVHSWTDDHGGSAATSVAEAVDVIASGAVWIDHSTISADGAWQYGEALRTQGAEFLDAPVSGGVGGARNGSLTVMVGGQTAAFERMKPTMAAYAGRVTLMGESGAGQITKMTNLICVVGLVLDEAKAMGISLPATALVGRFLSDVDALGGADLDWCSLMMRQRQFVPESTEQPEGK